MSKTIKFTRPVSIYPGQKQNGDPSRRLAIRYSLKEFNEIPEELFGVKVSQSKQANRAGRLVFKHIAYKMNTESPWLDYVAPSFNIASPVADIKASLLKALTDPEAVIQVTINMPGKFGNIDTADGRYTLFDFNEQPDGNLGYYLRGETLVTITLTPSEYRGNDYYRVALSTDKTPEEIFVKGGRGKRFGEESHHEAKSSSQGDTESLTWQ